MPEHKQTERTTRYRLEGMLCTRQMSALISSMCIDNEWRMGTVLEKETIKDMWHSDKGY